MVTDPVPRAARLRRQYDESDAHPTLVLPEAAPLQQLCTELRDALEEGHQELVRRAGQAMLDFLAASYEVKAPRLRVLGARPHQVIEGELSYELFGDYTPSTEIIRAWMRTAIRGKVTSHRGLLNTILHEFCHHLDVRGFGWTETPHTRGFYGRVDDLYHLALATPPEARKPLVWIKRGGLWRIDWSKLRRSPSAG